MHGPGCRFALRSMGRHRRRQRRRDSRRIRDRGRWRGNDRIVLQQLVANRLDGHDHRERHHHVRLRPVRHKAAGHPQGRPARRRVSASARPLSLPGRANFRQGGARGPRSVDRRRVDRQGPRVQGRRGLALHRASDRRRCGGDDPSHRRRHGCADRLVRRRAVRAEPLRRIAPTVDGGGGQCRRHAHAARE